MVISGETPAPTSVLDGALSDLRSRLRGTLVLPVDAEAATMRPFATGGAYVNDAWDEKPGSAFGVNDKRLIAIKNRYDPTNLFRHNTNIAPTVGA